MSKENKISRPNEHAEYTELDLDAASAGLWGPEALPNSDTRGRALRLARLQGVVWTASALDVAKDQMVLYLERGPIGIPSEVLARLTSNLNLAEEACGLKNPRARENINALVQLPAVRAKLEELVEEYGPHWQNTLQELLIVGTPHVDLKLALLAKGAVKVTETERAAARAKLIAAFLPEEKAKYDRLDSDAKRAYEKLSADERHADVFDPGLRAPE